MFSGLAQNGTTAWSFSSGGHQGGEGCDVAAEWYVEGVREELDDLNEFYYDVAAGVLYFAPNASDATGAGGAPPATGFAAPMLSTYFNLSGSAAAPVAGVSFEGLAFEGGAPTFMAPRGVPSGGDWALERDGVLFAEGSTGLVVTDCSFSRIDGNALFLSGWNRDALIARNVFENLGQSAIALWGRTAEMSERGWDGSALEAPLNCTIDSNFAHDIGQIQKQSSFLFQAVAALNTISNNIVYNIPRCSVNFDDAYGGGALMTRNLWFNTCRESSDHGAFNSWSRMPYATSIADGKTLSAIPAWNVASRNFLVANYGADGGCLDNDDGSSWYRIESNFCVYGGHKYVAPTQLRCFATAPNLTPLLRPTGLTLTVTQSSHSITCTSSLRFTVPSVSRFSRPSPRLASRKCTSTTRAFLPRSRTS